MKNTAKYAWSFSRNSSFLRGLFFMPHPVGAAEMKMNYALQKGLPIKNKV